MTTTKTIEVYKSRGGKKYHTLDTRYNRSPRYASCGTAKLDTLPVYLTLDNPNICKHCLRMYLKETGYRV